MYINVNVTSTMLLGWHLGADRLKFLEHAFDFQTIQREELCADGPRLNVRNFSGE